ncbi:aspartate and glycine-rich protein-like [Dicentrarchus labrax]|uniref:aspartate and glycine-rich protein-like n=1 Tax=Dicentrarchus labrax TaxID=13489 RepID=UPI0021F537F1|nr:aspartate and glycine-rich protein-like [Dicentrarchus labrax]XP_051246432.1 aspartate and glycine-rich protein-like [Dicentrarchus labrax]XP_051246433.1 aspartate and glycine-rich protein-like [Dicentrarchus labrax]XP_051246434.1 aspartate and glycine-rich protein-like [Dicentrarchus labrax]
MALRVKGKYPDGDTWLGPDGWRSHSVPGEWPVSYHGTSLDGAKGIIRSHYSAGDRAMYGRGIYSTPDIHVAEREEYAKTFTSESTGKSYKVILQNRINPEKREICQRDDYWLIPVHEGTSAKEEKKIMESSIRPYGILIKKLKDDDEGDEDGDRNDDGNDDDNDSKDGSKSYDGSVDDNCNGDGNGYGDGDGNNDESDDGPDVDDSEDDDVISGDYDDDNDGKHDDANVDDIFHDDDDDDDENGSGDGDNDGKESDDDGNVDGDDYDDEENNNSTYDDEIVADSCNEDEDDSDYNDYDDFDDSDRGSEDDDAWS